MTDLKLTKEDVRVIGCLIEKEMTTPDYYPLSLNALVNACNQKSNRDPVVSYSEETVLRTLDSLKSKELAWQSDLSRVAKYSHNFLKARNLVNKEAAILCILFLRGHQTAGEIRERTERLYKFNTIEESKEVLNNLEEMGYVKLLPRQHGMKEQRYTHLFSDIEELPGTDTASYPVSYTNDTNAEDERIEKLREELTRLRQELETLRQEFQEFKQQF
ncbi:MAG: YceH family protein [Nitrospirae bacterium]|nr:YceH family protein [Nitrospirota bacterium]